MVFENDNKIEINKNDDNSHLNLFNDHFESFGL